MPQPPGFDDEEATDPGVRRGASRPDLRVVPPAPTVVELPRLALPTPPAPSRSRAPVVLLAGLALLAVAPLPFCAWVPDEDMVPSFLPGDVVMVLPLTPRAGDVVAVVDPLDPKRWTLRRVESIGGTVRYDDVSFIVDDRRPELLDMGRDDGSITLQEGNHLIRHLPRAVHGNGDVVAVPVDAAFLSADNRDLAVDSRWWGAVPLAYVQGVVVLRAGVPVNPWRSWVEGRAG